MTNFVIFLRSVNAAAHSEWNRQGAFDIFHEKRQTTRNNACHKLPVVLVIALLEICGRFVALKFGGRLNWAIRLDGNHSGRKLDITYHIGWGDIFDPLLCLRTIHEMLTVSWSGSGSWKRKALALKCRSPEVYGFICWFFTKWSIIPSIFWLCPLRDRVTVIKDALQRKIMVQNSIKTT